MRSHPPGTPAALLALLLAAGLPGARPAASQELPQAPYLTTPTGTVQRMLELVEVTAADTVYDLGSGDGRIPIIAAARYGASAVGVELRRDLVEEARRRAESTGVADRVRFVHDDLFDVDLSPATVVTIYLLPSVNLRLRPKLLDDLRPGARIVSNGFDMGDWEPDVDLRDLEAHMVLYGWVVPARLEGRWRIRGPGRRTLTVAVDQRFQELRARVVRDGAGDEGWRVIRATLRGADVRLVLRAPGERAEVVYRGRMVDGSLRGTTGSGGTWSAERIAAGGSMDRWDRARSPGAALARPAGPR